MRARGGAEGNRTPDFNYAIVALYQLSYSPDCGMQKIAAPRPDRNELLPEL